MVPQFGFGDFVVSDVTCSAHPESLILRIWTVQVSTAVQLFVLLCWTLHHTYGTLTRDKVICQRDWTQLGSEQTKDCCVIWSEAQY